jgi:hypothetical protein
MVGFPATLVTGILCVMKEVGRGFNELNLEDVIRDSVSGITSLGGQDPEEALPWNNLLWSN